MMKKIIIFLLLLALLIPAFSAAASADGASWEDAYVAWLRTQADIEFGPFRQYSSINLLDVNFDGTPEMFVTSSESMDEVLLAAFVAIKDGVAREVERSNSEPLESGPPPYELCAYRNKNSDTVHWMSYSEMCTTPPFSEFDAQRSIKEISFDIENMQFSVKTICDQSLAKYKVNGKAVSAEAFKKALDEWKREYEPIEDLSLPDVQSYYIPHEVSTDELETWFRDIATQWHPIKFFPWKAFDVGVTIALIGVIIAITAIVKKRKSRIMD
jgi:hypothetical protein